MFFFSVFTCQRNNTESLASVMQHVLPVWQCCVYICLYFVCVYIYIYVCVCARARAYACLCIFSIANLYWSFKCMRVCSTVWFAHSKTSVHINNSEVLKDLRFTQHCWWGCSSCGIWRFVAGYLLCLKGMCYRHLHHPHKEKSFCTVWSSKMGTSCSFKMPATHYPVAQCNNPEDLNLQ